MLAHLEGRIPTGDGGTAAWAENCAPDAASREAPADVLDPADHGERWTLLYTRSHCEKLLARACTHFGIRHYLPLWEQTCVSGVRVSAVPLFPSYVFACLNDGGRLDVLQTNVVAHVIRVGHPELMLEELRQIRRALAAEVNLAVGPAIERGDRVRVVRGPLAGLEGLVVKRRRRAGHPRLVLNVSILGQAVMAEIDLSDVVRIGGRILRAVP